MPTTLVELRYRIRNTYELKNPHRRYSTPLHQHEIDAMARDGFLVRERHFAPDHVACLKAALDVIAARERGGQTIDGKDFGGLFLRHLMDKDPAFLELLRFPLGVSLARALLGPQIQLRGLSARISFPDEKNQETEWHFHQRLIPEPVPAFFSRPQTIDCLLYLDETNDANGPVCLMPGSHQWTTSDLERGDTLDKPGQLVLRLPAGSCLFMHGSLWHRALPTRPDGTVRRVLIFGYGPTWMKASIYGEKPKDGLTSALLKDADEETRELLGIAGYM